MTQGKKWILQNVLKNYKKFFSGDGLNLKIIMLTGKKNHNSYWWRRYFKHPEWLLTEITKHLQPKQDVVNQFHAHPTGLFLYPLKTLENVTEFENTIYIFNISEYNIENFLGKMFRWFQAIFFLHGLDFVQDMFANKCSSSNSAFPVTSDMIWLEYFLLYTFYIWFANKRIFWWRMNTELSTMRKRRQINTLTNYLLCNWTRD